MTWDNVFRCLLDNMEYDNGFRFTYDDDHKVRAKEPIIQLIEAGYFQDSHYDLDGSFWQCAAGEATEAKEYFSRKPIAYQQLSDILNEIFESP
jgi:hypothetical protein